MIGNHFIFIHINRTGGSSVEASLKKYGSKDSAFWKIKDKIFTNDSVSELFRFYHPQHFTALEYKKIIGEVEFNKRFIFTVVRNPWDRMLSQYASSLKIEKVNKEDFNNWIIETFSSPENHDLPCSYQPEKCISHQRMIMPCTHWLADSRIDYVIRFENYDEDVKILHKILGKRIGDNLEKLKRTKIKFKSTSQFRKSDYRLYYADESKKIIEENFLSDIKFFGYCY